MRRVVALFEKKNKVATRFVNNIDIDVKNFDDFVLAWNERMPVDRWWREKYKTPFLSEEHKKMNPIDIYLEFREDKLYKELRAERVEEELSPEKDEDEKYQDFLEECKNTDYESFDDDE